MDVELYQGLAEIGRNFQTKELDAHLTAQDKVDIVSTNFYSVH
jgi:hypothetical protein